MGEDFTLARLAYVRKHSRQTYWDLHVWGTNNYLSCGIVNHNSGKSHFFAEYLVERMYLAPTRAVCIREVQKSLAQSVKRLIEDKIAALGLSAHFEITQTEVRGRNGSLCVFVGMQNHTADSIKSFEGFDVAFVEEAQSLSARSLALLTPTIRKPGSEIWFAWNPSRPDDPVDALLRGEHPPADCIVVEANHRDNPWFPEALKADMERDRERDAAQAAHVWDGAYQTAGEARVFKHYRVAEFSDPPGVIYRQGADWGFANDPTVLVRCYIHGRELRVTHCVQGVGVEIDHTPALFDTVPQARLWPIVADSARPETISYMKRAGFRVREAIKGAGSIEEGVRFLKSFDIVVHPRCDGLLMRELERYSYKTDPHTLEVLPVLEDKYNNAIDALRYACEGVRRAPKPEAKVIAQPKPRDGYRKWTQNTGGVDWKTV